MDVWGNSVSYVNLLEPLTRLEVSCESVVETFTQRKREPESSPGPGEAWEIEHGCPAARLMLYDYLQPTPLTVGSEELRRYVRHGFETVGCVFQGLQQFAPPPFEIAAVHRGNRVCARGAAFIRVRAAELEGERALQRCLESLGMSPMARSKLGLNIAHGAVLRPRPPLAGAG